MKCKQCRARKSRKEMKQLKQIEARGTESLNEFRGGG